VPRGVADTNIYISALSRESISTSRGRASGCGYASSTLPSRPWHAKEPLRAFRVGSGQGSRQRRQARCFVRGSSDGIPRSSVGYRPGPRSFIRRRAVRHVRCLDRGPSSGERPYRAARYNQDHQRQAGNPRREGDLCGRLGGRRQASFDQNTSAQISGSWFVGSTHDESPKPRTLSSLIRKSRRLSPMIAQ